MFNEQETSTTTESTAMKPTVKKDHSKKAPKPKAKPKGKAKGGNKGKAGFEKIGILDVMREFFTKGGTKQDCLALLKKKFPKRPEVGMYRTINTQLSAHLPKKYKIEHNKEKKFWKITLKKSESKKAK